MYGIKIHEYLKVRMFKIKYNNKFDKIWLRNQVQHALRKITMQITSNQKAKFNIAK